MKLSNKEKIDCKIQYYIWQRWKQIPQNLVQIYSMKKKVVEYPISDDNPKKAFTVSSDNRQSDDHRFDLLSLQFHCLNSLQKKLMQNRKKNVFSKWLDIAKHIDIIPCADWFMQALIETNETIIFTFYAIRKSRIEMLCSVAVVKSIVTEKIPIEKQTKCSKKQTHDKISV